METDIELKELGYYTGSEHHYKMPLFNYLYTDGIKYIQDNGYAWFITDAMVIVRSKFKDKEFICIKLTVDKEAKTAKMEITDGNEEVLYVQSYTYTNAKVDLTLYYTDDVLMYCREY